MVIVVPALPCADPAAPLTVPFRILVMPDIVVLEVCHRMLFRVSTDGRGKYIRDETLLCCTFANAITHGPNYDIRLS